MYYITFNGETTKQHGIEIPYRPSIPAPVMRGEYIQIAGRDGSLLDSDGTFENIEIAIEMNFVSDADTTWNAKYREVKNWLTGKGELRFSDDTEIFYKVKAVGISEVDRRVPRGGDISAVFICEPFAYYESGAVYKAPEAAADNPGILCKPIYKITGNGTATLTVNGKSVSAVVGQNLIIDTDLMIAYRENGTLENTAITGDYEDLWLNPGTNTIAISGLTLQVKPNYRSL